MPHNRSVACEAGRGGPRSKSIETRADANLWRSPKVYEERFDAAPDARGDIASGGQSSLTNSSLPRNHSRDEEPSGPSASSFASTARRNSTALARSSGLDFRLN